MVMRSMKDMLPDDYGRSPPRALTTLPKPADAFDGSTYHAKEDHQRLKGQLEKVHALMLDGAWRTLASISEAVGGSEASISARLRDLRKPKYGGLIVARERMNGNGLYQYRVTAPAAAAA